MGSPANIIVLCGANGSGKSTLANMIKTSKQVPKIIENCDIIKFILSIIHCLNYDEVPNLTYQEVKLRCLLGKYIDKSFEVESPIRTLTWTEEELSSITEVAFANPIKKIIMALFNIQYDILLGIGEENRILRSIARGIQYEHTKGMTARTLMKYVGNTIFRENYDDLIWFNIALTEIEHFPPGTTPLISDLRFKHEYKQLKKLDKLGTKVEIYRIIRNEDTEPSDIDDFYAHNIYNTKDVLFMMDQYYDLVNAKSKEVR